MSDAVRDIRLDEIEELMGRLARQVRERRFEPTVVVYLEDGARVPAVWLARRTGWPLLPLRIQRPDVRWKRLAAPLIGLLPSAVSGWLRRGEARRKFHVRGPRIIRYAPVTDLTGQRVLVLDDAADSGATILKAREWLGARGARPADVAVAVLAATTASGRETVDACLFESLCRFPWSADSADARRHQAVYREFADEVESRRWKP